MYYHATRNRAPMWARRWRTSVAVRQPAPAASFADEIHDLISRKMKGQTVHIQRRLAGHFGSEDECRSIPAPDTDCAFSSYLF